VKPPPPAIDSASSRRCSASSSVCSGRRRTQSSVTRNWSPTTARPARSGSAKYMARRHRGTPRRSGRTSSGRQGPDDRPALLGVQLDPHLVEPHVVAARVAHRPVDAEAGPRLPDVNGHVDVAHPHAALPERDPVAAGPERDRPHGASEGPVEAAQRRWISTWWTSCTVATEVEGTQMTSSPPGGPRSLFLDSERDATSCGTTRWGARLQRRESDDLVGSVHRVIVARRWQGAGKGAGGSFRCRTNRPTNGEKGPSK
jgi:hypothetical protein